LCFWLPKVLPSSSDKDNNNCGVTIHAELSWRLSGDYGTPEAAHLHHFIPMLKFTSNKNYVFEWVNIFLQFLFDMFLFDHNNAFFTAIPIVNCAALALPAIIIHAITLIY
jgi:hypothetical protein